MPTNSQTSLTKPVSPSLRTLLLIAEEGKTDIAKEVAARRWPSRLREVHKEVGSEADIEALLAMPRNMALKVLLLDAPHL